MRLTAFMAIAALLGASACQEDQAAPERSAGAPEQRVRAAVIAGARVDFHHTEGVSPAFIRCFLPELRRELDRESLEWLGAVRGGRGEPAAARALNTIAAPVGDRCGERWLVPQLVEAASRLPSR